MHPFLWFILTLIACVVITLGWQIGGPSKVKAYFSKPGRDRVQAGIEVFLVAAVLAALTSLVVHALTNRAEAAEPPETGSGVEWFAFGEVYAGLDYTEQKTSPACFEDGVDDRLTSNGGVRVNVMQVAGGAFQLNGKYTHHSCALNSDRYLYDGFGLEATYRLW